MAHVFTEEDIRKSVEVRRRKAEERKKAKLQAAHDRELAEAEVEGRRKELRDETLDYLRELALGSVAVVAKLTGQKIKGLPAVRDDIIKHPTSALNAANSILDRVLGKPGQEITHKGEPITNLLWESPAVGKAMELKAALDGARAEDDSA